MIAPACCPSSAPMSRLSLAWISSIRACISQRFRRDDRLSPRRPSPDRRHSGLRRSRRAARSEEHTSELQSLMRISYAVFCLKKTNHNGEQTPPPPHAPPPPPPQSHPHTRKPHASTPPHNPP